MKKFLIIQTAFIGDVVLATAIVEELAHCFPNAPIHFLLRKGNEGLLKDHPKIKKVWIWDKKKGKYKNLLRIIWQIRAEKYSHVINLQRFANSGLVSFLSKATHTIGFDKNPFAFSFTHKIPHIISKPYSSDPIHETDRNHDLIAHLTKTSKQLPKLYPSIADYEKVKKYKQASYYCIAPSSVWFTKQFPEKKWIALINQLPENHLVYLLGGKNDEMMASSIAGATTHPNTISLCGQLNFLASAALMKDAVMNFVNDSAPLHFASAMNAPVTAIYCSTVPAFGFGPLSKQSKLVEIGEKLYCRPCGLHGKKACPEGHFKCALEIKTEQII